ncbi:hypothetical protein Lepil_0060 [Leptonema illini DSM 21528]|uniref:Uncharacterized protein n=2 Tax=Leptonema illini TaxID=183 RepID=H2CGU5_9LEPT|nr:hypothetical protein Lepil_0060 [Leptonema illini DSM 21528]
MWQGIDYVAKIPGRAGKIRFESLVPADIVIGMGARRFLHFILMLLAGFLPTLLMAEVDTDARGDRNVNDVNRNIKVNLWLEKTVFKEDEPIAILFRITNAGHRTVRLYPFTPEERSFQFEVLDRNGRELGDDPARRFDPDDDVLENHPVDLAGDRTREIQLQPGETFERRLYLDRHYDLKPGEYRVSGLFLPDARHDIMLRTVNRLKLRIEKRTSPFVYDEAENTAVEAGPDAEETVYLFLSAEMAGKTEKYLKYVDLRKFILSYDMFARQYLRSSKQQQEVVLQRFAEYLKSGPTDPLRRFRILRGVQETPDRMRVDVLALRSSGSYRVEYMYNYYLDRAPGSQWKITSVVAAVQNK